jgi:hypothetical protein
MSPAECKSRSAKSQRPLIGEDPSNLWGEVATSGLGFSLVVLDLESAYKRALPV